MPQIIVNRTDTFEEWRLKTNLLADEVSNNANRTITLANLPSIGAKTILGNSLAAANPLVNTAPVAITVSEANGIIITDARALQLVTPLADGGITMNSSTGALRVKLPANSGLVVSTAGLSLALATNSGLLLTTDNKLALSLATNSGLLLTTDNKLALSLATNSGLVLTDNKLALAVVAATDSGLVLDNENKIKIRLKTATVVTGVPTKVISSTNTHEINDAGSGYQLNDILTITGGTLAPNGTAARFRVDIDRLTKISNAIISATGTFRYMVHDLIRVEGGRGSTLYGVPAYFNVNAISDITGALVITEPVSSVPQAGYQVNDTLTIIGGTFTTAATFKVVTLVSGSTAVATVVLISAGAYTVSPWNYNPSGGLARIIGVATSCTRKTGNITSVITPAITCRLIPLGSITGNVSMFTHGNYSGPGYLEIPAFPANPVSTRVYTRLSITGLSANNQVVQQESSTFCTLMLGYTVGKVTCISFGTYTTIPENPAATTVSSGSAGTGCRLQLKYTSPDSVVNIIGTASLYITNSELRLIYIGTNTISTNTITLQTLIATAQHPILIGKAISATVVQSPATAAQGVPAGAYIVSVSNINNTTQVTISSNFTAANNNASFTLTSVFTPSVLIPQNTPIRGIGLQDGTVTNVTYAANTPIASISLSKPIVYPGITQSDYTISTLSGNNPASGLEIISSGGLAIKCGETGTTGLIVDQYGLRVKLVTVVVPEVDYDHNEKLSGLLRKSDGAESTHGLSIARPLASGLDITASGLKIKLAPDSGLDITASGLKIKLAPVQESWSGNGITDAGLMIRYKPNIVSTRFTARMRVYSMTALLSTITSAGTSPFYSGGHITQGTDGAITYTAINIKLLASAASSDTVTVPASRTDFFLGTKITGLNSSAFLITVTLNGGVTPHFGIYGFKLYKRYNTLSEPVELHDGFTWWTGDGTIRSTQCSFSFLDTNKINVTDYSTINSAGSALGTSIETWPSPYDTYSTIVYWVRFMNYTNNSHQGADAWFDINGGSYGSNDGYGIQMSSMIVQEMPV